MQLLSRTQPHFRHRRMTEALLTSAFIETDSEVNAAILDSTYHPATAEVLHVPFLGRGLLALC